MRTITIDVRIAITLRDALRKAGSEKILLDYEYDVLLHLNAKIEEAMK